MVHIADEPRFVVDSREEIQTLNELLDDVAGDARTLGTLLGFFAGLALVLAVVGI